MSLRAIAISLGILIMACGISGVVAPVKLPDLLKRFPRSAVAGWLLTAMALAWAAVLLCRSSFLLKYSWSNTVVLVLLPIAFLGLVFFLDELLAARALGGLLILAGSPVLEIARIHVSPWRVVVPALVYIWVITGMVLMLSPFVFRQTVERLSKSQTRFRITGTVIGCVGLCVVGVAIAVY